MGKFYYNAALGSIGMMFGFVLPLTRHGEQGVLVACVRCLRSAIGDALKQLFMAIVEVRR